MQKKKKKTKAFFKKLREESDKNNLFNFYLNQLLI